MFKRSSQNWVRYIDFIIIDAICLLVAYIISSYFRYGFQNPFRISRNSEMLIVTMLFNLLIIILLDTMNNIIRRGYYLELISILGQTIVMMACLVMFLYISKLGYEYSRTVFSLMFLYYVILTYISRIAWKKYRSKLFGNKSDCALLIVADEKKLNQIIQEVKTDNYGRHSIVGVLVKDSTHVGQKIDGVEIVGTYKDLVSYATRNWVEEVLVILDNEETIPEKDIDILANMGITIHLYLESLSKRVALKQEIGYVGGLMVVSSSMNSMSARDTLFKRMMDIIGGVIGCLITGILYLILAPFIKKESPGPVFFSQTRVGKNGKPFKLYKFRSMYQDAEERKKELMDQNRVKDGMMFKLEFDPRVIGNKIDKEGNKKTGIGEFIRKYSLDEFPQFYNVLKGDMSLVGTRPPLVEEYQAYSAHHKARLAMKPGLTGMWQVSGRSNIMDFEEVVKLDTQYINNWSIGLDLKILIKTFFVVLKKDGSM